MVSTTRRPCDSTPFRSHARFCLRAERPMIAKPLHLARELSGLIGTEEVPHDPDKIAAGAPTDAIRGSLRRMAGTAADASRLSDVADYKDRPQSIGRPMPLSTHRLVDFSMYAPAPLNPWIRPKGRNPPKS